MVRIAALLWCDYGLRSESAALAQLVEHIIRNDGVTCSSHVSGTTFFKVLSQAKSSVSYQRAMPLAGRICLLKGPSPVQTR